MLCVTPNAAHRGAALPLAFLFSLFTASTTTQAQSIDTRPAKVTIGQPLAFTVHVRRFDSSDPAPFSADCLQARIHQGLHEVPVMGLQWRTGSADAQGNIPVHFSSPEITTEAVLQVQLKLQCGAEFIRDFQLLPDPPRRHNARASRSTDRNTAALPTADVPKLNLVSLPPPALANPVTSALPVSAPPHLSTAASATQEGVPAPVSSSASGPDLDDVVRVVLNTLNQSAGHSPGPMLSGLDSNGSASAPPWKELQAEQQRTRDAIFELQLRLERSERETWRDLLIAIGTLTAITCLRLIAQVIHDSLLPRYHGVLQRRRTQPVRSIPPDLATTDATQAEQLSMPAALSESNPEIMATDLSATEITDLTEIPLEWPGSFSPLSPLSTFGQEFVQEKATLEGGFETADQTPSSDQGPEEAVADLAPEPFPQAA